MTNSPENDTTYEHRLEVAKRASTAQLLFKCARLLNEQALERTRHLTGYLKLRAAHTSLFPHIDLEGTRLTELARKLGITKQAVAQLVSELVEMGMLERIPDPTDGRAKLIQYSHQGREGLFHGLAVLRQFEDDLTDTIGAEQMDALRGALLLLHDELERRDAQR